MDMETGYCKMCDKHAEEIASLREQLAFLQEELGNPPTDFHLLKEQLTDMTKERDEIDAEQIRVAYMLEEVIEKLAATEEDKLENYRRLTESRKSHAATEADRDTWRQKAIELGLEASQAEALLAQYREALEDWIDFGGTHMPESTYKDDIWESTEKLLAIPSPQAALNNAIAIELEQLGDCVCGECDTLLWNRAKELREMK